MAEIDELRELVKGFWSGAPLVCRKHPGASLSARFVESAYSDHIVFECDRGGESFTVSQRPRQKEFNPWQTEGLVVFLEWNYSILCFRCQSRLMIDRQGPPGAKAQRFTFTCVRCLSWGTWEGDPKSASIESPVSRASA